MSTVNAGWRGPNIVKEGLVLYLDAASGTSYSPYTSGTTWRDISGNGNNAFFTNGASYSTSNGGVVALDGANDFVTLNSFAIPNNNGQLSINMWINIPASPGSNLATLYGDGSQSNNIGYLWSYLLVHDITYQYATNSVGRQNIVLSNYMLNSYNMWVNYCIVIDYTALTFAAYKNGVSFSTGGLSAAASFPTANRTRYIGAYSGGGGLFLLSGLVGPFMMYAKTLSAQEVLQNYNSVKSRFGL
jgi:hypothetical protein